jgi:hypothetical protein
MKQSVAIQHLRTMLLGVQRLRSILSEDHMIGNDPSYPFSITEYQAGNTWKWIWGKNCIIPILVKVIDDAETKGELRPQDFYNMMTIACSLEPLIGTVAGITEAMATGSDTFPTEASISWLGGWDKES